MNLRIGSLHSRVRMSSIAVPEASPNSMRCSPRQPEIQVVVRQQDRFGRAEICRFVLLEPENLRRRVPRQHRVAGQRDQFVLSAKLVGERLALRGGRGVAPEFRWGAPVGCRG